MVDISLKPQIYREAIASGRILLKKKTIDLIVSNRIEKGNVFATATIAAILAAKKTAEIIPLCHPLPITHVDVSYNVKEDHIEVTVKVKTTAQTGVEMEALTGASVALLTIWDMVKKYEKNEKGQYPTTKITDIRVVSKVKRENEV